MRQSIISAGIIMALLLGSGCEMFEGQKSDQPRDLPISRKTDPPAKKPQKVKPKKIKLAGMVEDGRTELYVHFADAASKAEAGLEEVKPSKTNRKPGEIVYFVKANGGLAHILAFVAEMSKDELTWKAERLQISWGPPKLSGYNVSGKWTAYDYFLVPGQGMNTPKDAEDRIESVRQQTHKQASVLVEIYKAAMRDIEIRNISISPDKGRITARAEAYLQITGFIDALNASEPIDQASFSGVHQIKSKMSSKNQQFEVEFNLK